MYLQADYLTPIHFSIDHSVQPSSDLTKEAVEEQQRSFPGLCERGSARIATSKEGFFSCTEHEMKTVAHTLNIACNALGECVHAIMAIW